MAEMEHRVPLVILELMVNLENLDKWERKALRDPKENRVGFLRKTGSFHQVTLLVEGTMVHVMQFNSIQFNECSSLLERRREDLTTSP